MEDLVSKATKSAIRHAKYRHSSTVDIDDLLVGTLNTISRFDIVKLSNLTIDLEDLDGIFRDAFKDDVEPANQQKVSYSDSVNDLFIKAALVARKDYSPKVEIVHLLVAFAEINSGLMAQLKSKYGFSGREWRVALSDWQFFSSEHRVTDSKIRTGTKTLISLNERQFYSPDEAAEFLMVHVQTIRGYIRTGKLPALRLAGERALRIKREDLLALLEPYNPEDA